MRDNGILKPIVPTIEEKRDVVLAVHKYFFKQGHYDYLFCNDFTPDDEARIIAGKLGISKQEVLDIIGGSKK